MNSKQKESSSKKDYYALLEIENACSEADIKKAYRRGALVSNTHCINLMFKKWHPDKVEEGRQEEATEKFKLISEAYSVLSNPKRRAYYDKHGMTEEDAMNEGDYGFSSGGFSSAFDDIFSGGGFNFGFMDDDDDMEDFMDKLSKEQFKGMFKDLGKNYRSLGK